MDWPSYLRPARWRPVTATKGSAAALATVTRCRVYRRRVVISWVRQRLVSRQLVIADVTGSQL